MCIRPTWWLYFAAFCQHLIKHVMMMMMMIVLLVDRQQLFIAASPLHARLVVVCRALSAVPTDDMYRTIWIQRNQSLSTCKQKLNTFNFFLTVEGYIQRHVSAVWTPCRMSPACRTFINTRWELLKARWSRWTNDIFGKNLKKYIYTIVENDIRPSRSECLVHV